MSKDWWNRHAVGRRDERASKDTPETPTSIRVKKARKRSWVLEYRLPKQVQSEHAWMWSMWKRDGEWHKYGSRYVDDRAASNAMTREKSKWERDHFQRVIGIEWRIRNTEVVNESV